MNGILGAYYQALQNFALSGPTIMSQVINQAAAISAQRPVTQDSQHYTVLLILTDGVINDKEQTIQAIINASSLPVSVLILGLGNEDFTEMEKLDGDSNILTSRSGQKTKRDIVQFVSMRKMAKYQGATRQAQIAKSLLEELPQQVLDYYKAVRIQPNDPMPPPPYEEPTETTPPSGPASNSAGGSWSGGPIPSLPTPGP